MIAYIVASHGDFSEGIKNSAFMIFGKQEKVETVTFERGDSPDELAGKYQKALDQFDADDQVIFLVDLYGGTPFNVASRIVADNIDRMSLVTGLNLSMLVEAFTVRDQDIKQVVPHLEATAKAGVRHLELQNGSED